MAPLSEPPTTPSTSPTTKCRPVYYRSCTVLPHCHPTQMARAQLGDTKGAIFLPVDDSPPSSPALSTTVSIFGTSRTDSPVSNGTSSPILELKEFISFQQLNAQSSPQKSSTQELSQSSEIYPGNFPKRRRLTPPSSPGSFSSASSNFGGQQESINTPGSPDPCRQLHNLRKPQNATEGRRKSLQRKMNPTDSACEELSDNQHHASRGAFADHDEARSPDMVKVHFAADEHLFSRYNYERRRSFPSHFLDPFAGLPATDGRRFSDASTASSYLRANAFAGHRDTLARLHQTPSIDSEADTQEYSISAEQPVQSESMPLAAFAVARLPAEVIHEIYQYLQPCDFDAARHTCRSWFLAGLDLKIGRQMMKMAGCTPAFWADLEHRQQILHAQQVRRMEKSHRDHAGLDITDCHDGIEEHFSEEWMIAKRLATECRLSAAWHGSGISKTNGHSLSRFTVTQAVNFNNLAFASENEDTQIKKFTVSVCGKFLLVIVGTDVFVYSIGSCGSALTPRVRLVAGKEILSVSMDTSSGRYAVAALLTGRMGMCWELKDIFMPSKKSEFGGEPISLSFETDVFASAPPTMQSVLPVSLPNRQDEHSLALDSSERREQQSYFDLGFASTSLYTSQTRRSPEEYLNNYESKDFEGIMGMPIRTKPTHVYKNIGCSVDGPRSVAICPQRKCVAFGCRAGIELHWVDALTGRNLNRWFPLAAPSDHLYFLPPRPGVDTAKKLRLISSAAGPSRRFSGRHNSNPASSKSSSFRAQYGRRQSMTGLFHGDLPFPSALDNSAAQPAYMSEEDDGVLRTVDCDHYHAVPLSDGVHMLFTDPKTGFLCLGSDAPLGGPTKLVRKVCMIPPKSEKFSVGALACYAVAQNLTWGVRVVAAYDDGSIVLYSVPSDCFERIRHIRSSNDVWDELTGVVGESDLLMDAFMANQRRQRTGTESTADTPAPSSPSSFRSLQINGAIVCRAEPGIEDLQIDSEGGGLRLWIFHRTGQARKMDIYATRESQPESYLVGVDGLLNLQSESTGAQTYVNISGDHGKSKEDQPQSECEPQHNIRMFGLDGAYDSYMHCDFKNLEDDLKLLEELNTQSMTVYPDAIMTPPIRRHDQDHEFELQLEVLTDWRDTVLLDPYLVILD